MSGFNYSKWDNIELSDDESDLHPNIDKDSWFRMKHRNRLEREASEDEEIKKIEELDRDDKARLNVIEKQLERLMSGNGDDEDGVDDVDALQGEAAELRGQVATRAKRVTDIKERRSWNMENICQVKEEKTIVNSHEAKSLAAKDFAPTGETEKRFGLNAEEQGKAAKVSSPPPSSTSTTTEKKSKESTSTSTAQETTTATTATTKAAGPLEEHDVPGARENFSVMSYNDFVLKHENILETYSVLTGMEESKTYIFKHCDILLHEHSQNYMLLSCLEDEMNGKRKRCDIVCRQSQILSHIQELGVSMKRDPRDVILPLFARLEEKAHFDGFMEQVGEFKTKIYGRAVEKRKEMDQERLQDEEANAPLGPGGLNPFTVLRELPTPLREAFESQDLDRLQHVLGEMDPMKAKACMKKCYDSGLWVASDPTVLDGEGDEEEEMVEEVPKRNPQLDEEID